MNKPLADAIEEKMIQPTYYVRHIDDTYTVASPQPVLEYPNEGVPDLPQPRLPDAWMYTAKGCKARFGDRWPHPIPAAWTEIPLYASPINALQHETED